MNLLVTGGAGFIGSNFTLYWVEQHPEDGVVVLEQSRIIGIAGIADSLIGRQVEVTRSGRRPRALRLMLGDHSAVDLE